MIASFFKNYSRLALAVFDGTCWRAYALERRKDRWACAAAHVDPSRNGKQLPKSVAEFARDSGARRLRVLTLADVQTLSLAMPPDLSDEEMHTALAYEAEAELGFDSRTQRVAAARCELYDMGGEPGSFALAAIDSGLIERFEYDAEQVGLSLDGVGSLEQTLLCLHADANPDQRLMVVRGHTSFYAVPSGELQPFLLTVLPLGAASVDGGASGERAERARERIEAHNELAIHVIICGDDADGGAAWLAPLIGDPKEARFTVIESLLDEVVRTAAMAKVGGVDSGCALIGLPPPPRDPHRHGTVIMALFVVLTLLWVGHSCDNLAKDRDAYEERLSQWDSLSRARERATAESDSLRDRQQSLRDRIALIERGDPLPPALMATLRALATSMPEYSRLISISACWDDGIDIVGDTLWQEGLTQLDEALRMAASDAGLAREFVGMETVEGRRSQRFRFRIQQRGGEL